MDAPPVLWAEMSNGAPEMTPNGQETRSNTSAATTTVIVTNGETYVAPDPDEALRESRYACVKIGLRHFIIA